LTLSELQIQANLPLLASATSLLDKRLRQGNYSAVLLSARDCYMQSYLWRRMFPSTPYQVIYWMSSRRARFEGSAKYLEYCQSLMKEKVLIFDLCGTGDSLRKLFERISLSTDYLILQSDPRRNQQRLTDGPGDIEGLNCAPHPSIVDVLETGEPKYENPLGINWNAYFEDIGGRAFFAEAKKRSDFSEFIDASEDDLLAQMKQAEALIAKHNVLFEKFHELRRKEDWQ
jgi:hypothetical protein